MEQGYQGLTPYPTQISQSSASGEGEAPSGGLNIKPYLRMLKRKAWLVVTTTVLLTGAALFKAGRAPDIYAGNFQILVEPITSEEKAFDPSALVAGDRRIPGGRDGGLDYLTQFEILTGPKMLEAIAEEIRKEYPEFPTGALRRGLVVERLGKGNKATKIIVVSFQGSNPEVVQHVLEVTSRKYLQYSLQERKSRISEGVRFIEEQIPELQNRVSSYQQQIQRIQQQYDLIDPVAQGGQLYTQLRDIESQRREIQTQLQEQRQLYTNLESQLNLTPDEAIAASALSENPGYQQLLAQYREIESQLKLESVRFSPDSPIVQRLQARLDSLNTLLNQQAQEILGATPAPGTGNPQILAYQNNVRLNLIGQLITAANQIELLNARDQALANSIQEIGAQARQFPAITRQYLDLQRQVEIASSTLNRLQVQRETLRVEAAQEEIPWELVSEPQVPKKNEQFVPQEKSSSKLLVAGLGGGLILGVGLAFLLEKYRDIFYCADDVVDTTKLPILALIPLHQATNKQAEQVKANQTAGDAGFLDAFDSLYASLRFRWMQTPRAVLVGSAEPGDGRSTIALHLAQAAAVSGQRVLLVDADLRSPQLHKRLGLPNLKGLSDLLVTESAQVKGLIQQTDLADTLYVLTAGQVISGAARLIASAHMQTLAAELQKDFDLVIYDTPEMLRYKDASFLSSVVDGILMTVSVGKTKQSHVMQVLQEAEDFHLPILGLVVNHLQPAVLTSTPASELDEDEIIYDTSAQYAASMQFAKAKPASQAEEVLVGGSASNRVNGNGAGEISQTNGNGKQSSSVEPERAEQKKVEKEKKVKQVRSSRSRSWGSRSTKWSQPEQPDVTVTLKSHSGNEDETE